MKTNITISETDPGSAPVLDASVELVRATQFRKQFKGTREAIIEEVENTREIPRVDKDKIIAEVKVADPNEKFLRVDAFRHPLNEGSNTGVTIATLK